MILGQLPQSEVSKLIEKILAQLDRRWKVCGSDLEKKKKNILIHCNLLSDFRI